MSTDNIVEVADLTSDNATLLLAAAEELELDAGVVATTSHGHFLVPESVAKKSGLDYETTEDRETREFEETLARDNALAEVRAEADAEARVEPAEEKPKQVRRTRKTAAAKRG